jgi:hypothetical protein
VGSNDGSASTCNRQEPRSSSYCALKGGEFAKNKQHLLSQRADSVHEELKTVQEYDKGSNC